MMMQWKKTRSENKSGDRQIFVRRKPKKKNEESKKCQGVTIYVDFKQY